jgi:uncharacterized protein (DUF697 family)
MTEKKYVILTDIKEFTYKNGLLTNQQIEKMLWAFDDIVMRWAEKYNISVVKSIWDAYLCFSDEIINAYDFSQYIIQESQKYDDQEKLEIKHMALRVSITYGDVVENKAMKLDDFFWESINLASRIIGITPRWKIFCTQQVRQLLPTKQYSKDLWEHSFHGILSKTNLFSLTKISQQDILKIAWNKKSLLKECETIVFQSACVSAILSSQPIPFIENFNVIGVHLYMIVKISQKLERWVTLKSSSKICKEVISPLWLGYFWMQGSNTVAKILLPWIGWYLFSPISFAVTYAMWKVYTAYLLYAISGETLENWEIKDIFLKQKSIWRDLAKKEKKNILKIGKSFYKDVLWIKKELWYSDVQKDLLQMLKNKKN